MTHNHKNSWAHAIRRYVYVMFIILFTFTLIAAGYLAWAQKSNNGLQRLTNNYHLTSSFHYLKAIKELRDAQSHLNNVGSKTYIGAQLQPAITKAQHEFSYSTAFYLVRGEIRTGLELQRTFADKRFGLLSVKLAQQILNFEESNQNYLENGASFDQIATDMKGLLVTLTQLTRLHSIIRDERLTELEAQENKQTNIFYGLLLTLFFVSVLVGKRGLTAIDAVIRKQKKTEEKIKKLALFDSLTNLPNRALSMDRLTQALNESQHDKSKVAVLFLDLDNFKIVNDTLGHDIGDKLLVQTSDRLRSVVRSSDTVGRLGGDEFVIILGKIADEADVAHIVEKLFDQIRTTFNIDGRDMVLSTSVGISIYPDDGDNRSELLRKADSAMYHSKSSGRNTYSFFTEAMNRDVLRRAAIEEQMNGALSRGEFEVFYQPQIDLACDRIMGAEALLRWHNPTLGSVSPKEFIPIAEQSGLIVPIGQYVLAEALNMTSHWQKEHDPEFRIAVNLSPCQFRDPHLVNDTNEAIQEAGISYHHLELEITEGVLMDRYSGIDNALAELKNLGVNIAMDDFGTGYSSLNNLRIYPFDTVKIDRSFVNDIAVDSSARALINAAICMAHSLNLKVVAEGVETEEQFVHLKELCCDYAQGYFFSKPVSETALTGMLEARNNERLSCV